MKRKYKAGMFILFILTLVVVLSGCEGDAAQNNPSETAAFFEAGERYHIEGFFSGTTSGDVRLRKAEIEVLEIQNNWLKVKSNLELESQYANIIEDMFNDLDGENEEWDYYWINLDNIIGATK